MEFYNFMREALYQIFVNAYIIFGIFSLIIGIIAAWKKVRYILTTPKDQRILDWLNELPPVKIGK